MSASQKTYPALKVAPYSVNDVSHSWKFETMNPKQLRACVAQTDKNLVKNIYAVIDNQEPINIGMRLRIDVLCAGCPAVEHALARAKGHFQDVHLPAASAASLRLIMNLIDDVARRGYIHQPERVEELALSTYYTVSLTAAMLGMGETTRNLRARITTMLTLAPGQLFRPNIEDITLLVESSDSGSIPQQLLATAIGQAKAEGKIRDEDDAVDKFLASYPAFNAMAREANYRYIQEARRKAAEEKASAQAAQTSTPAPPAAAVTTHAAAPITTSATAPTETSQPTAPRVPSYASIAASPLRPRVRATPQTPAAARPQPAGPTPVKVVASSALDWSTIVRQKSAKEDTVNDGADQDTSTTQV